MVNTIFGNVPVGSCLSYHIGRPKAEFYTTHEIPDNALAERPDLKFEGFPDVPILKDGMEEFDCSQVSEPLHHFSRSTFKSEKTLCIHYRRELFFRVNAQSGLKSTKRITASKFGRVYFCRQKPSDAMLTCIFKSKDLSNVKSIAHGKAKKRLQEQYIPVKCRSEVCIILCMMLASLLILYGHTPLGQVLMIKFTILLKLRHFDC